MIRNANLDLIKCIACFAVVGLHAVGMNNYTIYYLCGCGVPLFFMVNGYLLFSKENITYSYIGKKILSILKVVFLWNLLIMLPVLLFRHKIVNPVSLSVNSLLQKGYLWHFWFFGALILLYLFLPLLHKLFSHNRRFHILMVILCFAAGMLVNISSMAKGYVVQAYIPQPLRLWTWLFYFCIGGLIPFFLPYIQKISLWAHGLLTLLALLVNNQAIKHIGLYLTGSRIAEYYYDYLFSALFYLLLFTLVSRLVLSRTACKVITFLGSLTMGIFILHPILLMGINTFFSPSAGLCVFVFCPGLTLISGIMAYVMSKIPLVKELVRL